MKSKVLLLVVVLSAMVMPFSRVFGADTKANLDAVKTYLLGKATDLSDAAKTLAESTDAYYDLAKAANFDYAKMWKDNPKEVAAALDGAKKGWIVASPIYEQMEGIVGGVPSLSRYDAIIDASPTGAEDPENATDFTIDLPSGDKLDKPGSLFNLLESDLWGYFPEDIKVDKVDLDGDGTIGFGELLPDANLAKGGADALASYSADLLKAAGEWEPNESDAFTALVVMIPTMNDMFGSWKDSRFVEGDKATGKAFSVISRLSDMNDIISSIQVIYTGVGPLIEAKSAAQHDQINQGLTDLKSFVDDLYKQENDGKRFKPEEADLFGTEAQDRAETITGQITQAAALLDVTIQQ
ncbi:MAG: EfeM/EfeO family lipoprotein [Anaerolineae bacterium]|nr:EfeM/EfeO family lipoprotein [Anaerolineae bacterium]